MTEDNDAFRVLKMLVDEDGLETVIRALVAITFQDGPENVHTALCKAYREACSPEPQITQGDDL